MFSIVLGENAISLLRSHSITSQQKRVYKKIERVFYSLIGDSRAKLKERELNEVLYDLLPAFIRKATREEKPDFAKYYLNLLVIMYNLKS